MCSNNEIVLLLVCLKEPSYHKLDMEVWKHSQFLHGYAITLQTNLFVTDPWLVLFSALEPHPVMISSTLLTTNAQSIFSALLFSLGP